MANYNVGNVKHLQRGGRFQKDGVDWLHEQNLLPHRKLQTRIVGAGVEKEERRTRI